MSTTAIMTEGGLGRGCRRKARKILKRPSESKARAALFTYFRFLSQNTSVMASFRERLVAFFCKVLMMAIYQRTSSLFFMTLTHPKTPIFLMKIMGNLTLLMWMTVRVYPSFVSVRVTSIKS